MGMIRGKSAKSVAVDIAEGYTAVNPIMLKALLPEDMKEMIFEIKKHQNEIRAEKFPHKDTHAIRTRNLRLQRLHTSSSVITNFARERRLLIF